MFRDRKVAKLPAFLKFKIGRKTEGQHHGPRKRTLKRKEKHGIFYNAPAHYPLWIAFITHSKVRMWKVVHGKNSWILNFEKGKN